jgi:uncharacterized protein (DUF1697 family)
MQTLISFLRGVNMAGHNSIKMKDLTEMFTNSGFSDPETYIQSGNVIFNYSDNYSASEISVKIEKAIFERFSYNVPVMTRTIPELKEIILHNPFLKEDNFDPAKMAVIFLHEKCTSEKAEKVKDISYPPDKFIISDNEIFIYCPNGFGKTKLYTNFFEKKMGINGTARNWKTFTTILDIAKSKELK